MDESVFDSPLDDRLRLAALMLLLGNKELRDKLEPADFGVHGAYPSAAAELKRGTSYFYLQRILDSLGVIWDPANGHPVDAILRRVKLVSQRDEGLRLLAELSSNALSSATDENMERFVTRLRNLTDEFNKQ